MNPSAPPSSDLIRITLAGGCFWCLEAVYVRVQGVRGVQSGYANSRVPRPDYAAVCTGRTGAAEAVQIDFDPALIRLDEILDIFWQIHDPTTLNRQGADEGTQYRSGLYAQDAGQLALLQQAVQRAQAKFAAPIVTEVALLDNFTPAEPEHLRYFERQPNQGYCRLVVAPKVGKLRQKFAQRSSDGALL
ncbi:peptide-methionine (S)-S-oxide reductase MsrA [Amphibiibacter pelophylacis]|uniref:Peptide-methionine (S)-S-oxide reductase MsrA n=1 Tax=Amphibiibacter pelophylacis TaxID=1799477 RepID=A0ACC6P4S4_9BURK